MRAGSDQHAQQEAGSRAHEPPLCHDQYPAESRGAAVAGRLAHRRRRARRGRSNDPTSQDHKLAFLNGAVDRRTVSPDRVEPPASRYVLQAGAVIPAALITGIRSDLPGEVTAQVTEDVYDSPTGKILLIPQGARLVGQYDAQVSFGQSRVLLVWTRLIMPNGRSIVLERQPGADAAGYAGLEDEVDNHWGMLFKAAILSTLLSVGSEAGSSNNENSLVAGDPAGRLAELQPGRRAGRRPLPRHPTDPHDPPRLSGAGDRYPRPRPRTLYPLRADAWRS